MSRWLFGNTQKPLESQLVPKDLIGETLRKAEAAFLSELSQLVPKDLIGETLRKV